MQGVRYSVHMFFKSESGGDNVIDAQYAPSAFTESEVQATIQVAKEFIGGMLGQEVRLMTDEEITEYLKNKVAEEMGEPDMAMGGDELANAGVGG